MLQAPDGEVFSDPTWVSSVHKLVASIGPAEFSLNESGQLAGITRLAELDLETKAVRNIPITPEPGCRRSETLFPSALGDGRLAFLSDCIGTTWPPHKARSLKVWDPKRRELTELLPYRLPASTFRFSFSNDLRAGVIVRGSASGSYLAEMGSTGLRRIPLGLAEVHSARLSPDGDELAVVGERDDFGRATGAQNLFLKRFPSGELRPLLSGAEEIWPPAWSPDGRRLAVVVADAGRRGLWIFDAATGESRLVKSANRMGTLAWLPGGNAVVVAIGEYEDAEQRPAAGLAIVEVPTR